MCAEKLNISVGSDNFKEMATEYDVFVDKSLFIKEVIDSGEKAILLTHPRRWGKTLNLDMLKTFFEPESKECLQRKEAEAILAQMKRIESEWGLLDYFNYVSWSKWKNIPAIDLDRLKGQCNRDIFTGGKIISASGEEKALSGLQISTVDSGKYMQHQGKHPVIFLSLKNVVGNSIEKIESKLKELVVSLFEQYNYLKESPKLIDSEKARFQKYIDQDYTGISTEESIKFLSGLLHKHHGQKVYILIDEYDKPVNSLLEEYLGQEKIPDKDKFIKDVTNLISQTVCSSVSKTNPHLQKLILTGIFDTTQKESGSGCNNLSVYGISNINFSKSFGFSEEEVLALITRLSFGEPNNMFDQIKDWYNGYSVPISINQTIQAYTPWAVMKYLHIAYTTKVLEPQNYWTLSGASIILQKLLTKESCLNSTLSTKLLSIASNTSVELQFNQQISLFKYDWFSASNNEEFFSYLLLNSGYFTAHKINGKYMFSIPNAELLDEFASVIRTKDNEKCREILYKLQKTSQLKVVELIKQKDAEGIQREISTSHISCEDHSMNFNFFHLAAIFGNSEVFRTLLGSKCGYHLDFANDKLSNLKPLDYAFILRNDNITETIKNHYQNNTSVLMKVPGWSESIFCYTYQNPTSGGFISGVVDLAKDLVLGSLKVPLKAAGFIGTAILGSHAGELLEENCKQFTEYHKIDTSKPNDFKSLKQFEKYLLEHEHAYVVVNSDCTKQGEELVDITYNIFENSFYSNEELKFTLCDTSFFKEEL